MAQVSVHQGGAVRAPPPGRTSSSAAFFAAPCPISNHPARGPPRSPIIIIILLPLLPPLDFAERLKRRRAFGLCTEYSARRPLCPNMESWRPGGGRDWFFQSDWLFFAGHTPPAGGWQRTSKVTRRQKALEKLGPFLFQLSKFHWIPVQPTLAEGVLTDWFGAAEVTPGGCKKIV